MGLFSGLEDSLEKYIEGFFKDKFKGRVQPVEIAKRLAREMRDNRRVSVNNIYVPNEYKVTLHPEDWENIGAFNKLLALELRDYIKQKAEEKGYTPVAAPVVILEKDEQVEQGHIQIESHFSEGLPLPGEEEQSDNAAELLEEEQHTQIFQPVKDITLEVATPYLVVQEGHDAGKEFTLTGHHYVIGRRETCDIVLHDPSVSRKHAQLDKVEEKYILTDLNSTNGTYVNGQKVVKKTLEQGDIITFGTTICIYKV